MNVENAEEILQLCFLGLCKINIKDASKRSLCIYTVLKLNIYENKDMCCKLRLIYEAKTYYDELTALRMESLIDSPTLPGKLAGERRLIQSRDARVSQ